MTIRFQLLSGFFTLIIIFVVDFLINQQLSYEVITNTSYISNSESVIRNSNLLHKDMIEMQSSFRGFLLTEQETFLQPYYEGLRSIPLLEKEQRMLVSRKQQQMRLDTIMQIHSEWTEYADSLISTKRDTMPEATIRYKTLFEKKLRMEVGKKLNDRIKSIFSRFDSYEYLVRQQRRDALRTSIDRTKNITISLTIISIILSVFLCIYFVRSIMQRISRMVDFAKTISDGSFITIRDDKNDEMSRLVEALNKMSGTLDRSFNELSKKNNELDQFAYVVSHDLKAPLRGIANIISWMEEDYGSSVDPAIRKNHLLIKGRTDRLESMINGLLEYARIGKIRRGSEEVNTAQMVNELVQLLVPRQFRVRVAEDLPLVNTEKILLEQVFTNLISNAVKYNDKPVGEMEIGYKDLGEFHQFWVHDNGKGIDKQYFQKIFVIFQTLQERDAFESTGVGLAIVSKIIEDHKGTIKVESELGKGSTFTFTWPKNSNTHEKPEHPSR